MNASDPSVRPGDVLLGKFRVERVLGQGGMAMVVAAENLDIGERVALKFLLPATLAYPHLVARFLREAQATVKLRGEHVARVSDVGRMPGGEPFLVMEYLEGKDLSGVLDESRWGIAAPTAVDYVLQAIEGVAEAHSRGIVHRDLKPSNLFLIEGVDGSPHVKVLDFGIAKSTFDEIDVNLTATTAVMGSPQYMSPEQARSARSVDVRSDVWSLGVILYELLCGEVPFPGNTLPACIAALTADPPRPIRDRRTDIPPELEVILLRCLEKRPQDRFPDVGELALALAPFGLSTAHQRVDRILGILTQVRSHRPSSLSLAPAASAAMAATASADAGTIRQFDPESDTMPDDAPAVAVGEMNASDAADLVAAAFAAEEPEATSLSSTLPSFVPPALAPASAIAAKTAARRRLVTGAIVAVGIAAVLFLVFRFAGPTRTTATSAAPPKAAPSVPTEPAIPPAVTTNAEPKLAPSAIAVVPVALPTPSAATVEPVVVAPPPSAKRVPGPLPGSKTKPGTKPGDVCKGIFCE